MMGLYCAGKENSFPVTLFFFIETDSSAGMLLSLFCSFFHICGRHLLKPEFVPGTVLEAGNEGEKGSQWNAHVLLLLLSRFSRVRLYVTP